MPICVANIGSRSDREALQKTDSILAYHEDGHAFGEEPDESRISEKERVDSSLARIWKCTKLSSFSKFSAALGECSI